MKRVMKATGGSHSGMALVVAALLLWSVGSPTTTSLAQEVPKLDLFQCFWITHIRKSITVSLSGEFGSSTATAVKTRRLCSPATLNGEDPSVLTHPAHLLVYTLRQTSPQLMPLPVQQLTNRFGTFTLQPTHAIRYVIPTSASLSGPPPPLPSPPVLDHFDCYQVTGGSTAVSRVTTMDEFGTHVEDVLRPEFLCIPVSENGGQIVNPRTKLLCYKTRTHGTGAPPFASRGPVFVNHEFGPESFKQLSHVYQLCVPSSPSGAFLEPASR